MSSTQCVENLGGRGWQGQEVACACTALLTSARWAGVVYVDIEKGDTLRFCVAAVRRRVFAAYESMTLRRQRPPLLASI